MCGVSCREPSGISLSMWASLLLLYVIAVCKDLLSVCLTGRWCVWCVMPRTLRHQPFHVGIATALVCDGCV